MLRLPTLVSLVEEHGYTFDSIPVWLVIHGHHRVAFEDTMLLRKIALGEGLAHVNDPVSSQKYSTDAAYVLIVLLSNLLAGELLEPLLGLIAAVRLQAWNDERHVG